MRVSINPPMSPVTQGSNGVAAATIPNVCKMPGPPAPFVPAPLPNIGKSGDSPKGYSKSVTIEGKKVAIKGASFGSTGDMASKGTGGGVVSANAHGPTKFVGPGSMDVKIEGKNVQLLSDPMLNNCGGSGSPANSATLAGVINPSGEVIAVVDEECGICGKEHTFGEDKKTKEDAGTLAGNFKAQVDIAAAVGAAKVLPVKVRASTMLGVVRCKCGKKYADQSSSTTVEFCNAAKMSGMKHAPGEEMPSYADGNNYDETISNRVKAGIEAGLARRGADLERFQTDWANTEALARESDANRDTNPNEPAAFPPGFCAAQGALLLVMNDDAFPEAMTEQWFSSTGNATMSKIAHFVEKDGKRLDVTRRFKHGETVPPCKTCEIILRFLVCDGGDKPCTHKS